VAGVEEVSLVLRASSRGDDYRQEKPGQKMTDYESEAKCLVSGV
jgi:hypothetical protein